MRYESHKLLQLLIVNLFLQMNWLMNTRQRIKITFIRFHCEMCRCHTVYLHRICFNCLSFFLHDSINQSVDSLTWPICTVVCKLKSIYLVLYIVWENGGRWSAFRRTSTKLLRNKSCWVEEKKEENKWAVRWPISVHRWLILCLVSLASRSLSLSLCLSQTAVFQWDWEPQ